MGCRLGAGGVALVAMVATGTAVVAAPKCARPGEVTAIQAAAVQQQLMVAALTCNDVTSFNAFQTGFSKELRRSDRALLSMYRRLYGVRRGEKEYHAFKTRLANNSSIRSIHDNAAYCQEAKQIFDAALIPNRPTLADFVSSVPVHNEGAVDGCEVRVAAGMVGAKPAPDVVPKPNPLRLAALSPAPAAVVTPASAEGVIAAAPTPAQAVTNAPAVQQTAQKKDSGWLSGLFN